MRSVTLHDIQVSVFRPEDGFVVLPIPQSPNYKAIISKDFNHHEEYMRHMLDAGIPGVATTTDMFR